MTKTELAAMTIAELKALAKKNKVTLPVGAKKADIVKVLAGAAGASAPAKKKAAKKPATAAAKKPVARKAAPAKTAAPKKAAAAKPKRAAAKQPPKTGAPVRDWQMPAGVEEPLMAQERVSDAKYYTGTVEKKPPLPYDYLPHEYGKDRIVIMARDPYMAYSYWEVTQARLERERAWFGLDARLVIRVYDVTGVQFDGTNATAYFDQEVRDRTGTWYFDFGKPTHSFCADIGLQAPNGRFLTIARSNVVMMPRAGVSEVVDEEWMLVDEEFMKLYGLPGASTRGISSPELQELMRQRRLLQITSPGLFQKQKQKAKRK